MLTFRLASLLLYPLIFVAVCIASFFPAEGVFRLLGDKPSGDMRGLYASFGDRGYKLGANVDTSANWASGEFSLHTDQLGLRCDSDRVLAVHPGDVLDTLFIGDSQGVGNGVSFESTLAGSAAICARERNHLRVGNISVGGHTLGQQFELLQWLTETEHVTSRTYVLLITPVLTYGCDGYTHAVVGPDGRLYDEVKTAREMTLIYLKSHAVTYSRVRNAIRNAGIGVNPTRDTPFLFHPYGDGVDEAGATTELAQCIGRYKAFATAHSAKLAIVYVPLTVEAEFDQVEQAAASRGITLDRDLPARICCSVAASDNVPFLDLRPVLSQVHATGDSLHLKGDYHYDGKLSTACGESICRALPTMMGQNPISLSLVSQLSSWN